MSFKSWILGVAVSAIGAISAPAAFANPTPVYIDGQVGITSAPVTNQPVAYCRAETALPSGIATVRNTPEPLEAIIQSPPDNGKVMDNREQSISVASAPGLQVPVSMMGIRLPQGVNATVGGNPFNGEMGAQVSIQIVGSTTPQMKIGGIHSSLQDCLPLMVKRLRIERSMKLRESKIKSVIQQTKRDGLFSKIELDNGAKQREILDSLFRPKYLE